MYKVIIKNSKNNREFVLRTQDTYYEKISLKAHGTQLGIKQSINSFFSYCMEKGIGDYLLHMKKSEDNCYDLLQGCPLTKNEPLRIALPMYDTVKNTLIVL